MYTDPRSRKFNRRMVATLILCNVGLIAGAFVVVPTFGGTGLQPGMAGDKPVGVQAAAQQVVDMPAARVLDDVVAKVGATDVLKGWKPGRDGAEVEVPPVEVKCFAKGAPAPVTARTRGWVRGSVNSSGLAVDSVMWSVRAYGAGQGSAWVQHLRDTATACGVGVYAMPGLGVEAVTFTSGQVSTLVWRRGDVVSTFGYQHNHQPGAPSTVAVEANKVDQIIKGALSGVCADTESTFGSDAGRSPYVSAATYSGLFRERRYPVDEAVTEPPVGWEFGGGRTVKAVEPAAEPDDLAEKPSGEVPVSMPDVVDRPTKPSKPDKPGTEFGVKEQIVDVTGPGCGWSFTAQIAPVFDKTVAKKTFEDAVGVERAEAESAWTAWFPAAGRYKDAYEQYAAQVEDYNTYVTEVRAVSDMWALINDARAAYEEAEALYQKQVDDRAEFKARKTLAGSEYAEDQAFCATGTFTPVDVARPAPVCPVVRPAILDRKAPKVGDKPEKPDEEKIVKDYREAHPDPKVPGDGDA